MNRVKKQVKAIKFSLLSPEIIKKMSAAKIITPELYDVDGYPVDGGLMDLRLGAIDPGVRCRTCGGRLKECLGHPGSIEMARPVLHVKYIPIIELFLRSFCESCGRILLKDEDIKRLTIAQRIKKSKDVKKCPHCNTIQEKIKLEKPTTFNRGKRRVLPTEIKEILSRITDEDCRLVGVNPKTCRPEWAVLTLLIVPPVTVRPSITLESGERSEDDLTHKISDIIRANQRLWENLNAGAPEIIIEDLWDLLQYHVTTFFDNTLTRIPPARHRSGQPLKTITERIKGKEGRIRHNLAGKRVNFSSRTVVSPEPFMKIEDIGIPYEVARVITVSEKVNSINIEKLKKLILSKEYPGANYVIRPDGKKKRITDDLREELANEISPGYIVERHLQDGDIVLFNRHPSLHKPSLMSHFVKVLPYKTFRLHPAVTFPYNADFDGDEMNVHSPQTEEARSEAKILLSVKQNLISVKNNTNLIGCIADAITGNYLLSLDELEKEKATQLLYQSGIIPKITKKNLSGKETFSELLPKINYAVKTKSCLGKDCKDFDNCKKENCRDNAYLSIKSGELVSGTVDNKTFGVEDGILVKILDKCIGRDNTMETIERVFMLGTSYLSRRGLTISLKDFNVSREVIEEKEKVIRDAEDKTNSIIKSYYDGSLEHIPGKTNEESREIKILQTLNEVRSKVGKIIKQKFPKDNHISAIINSGAGGSILNITQIACCIGQQALWAKRISLGYSNRTLSFFKKNDLSPAAKGFIYSSFMNGVKPYEFFFGAMTGRDALMDTALRTPKSGYLYRRLANALQDLKVEYDWTVRDASGNIMQFLYGGDGIDVSLEHKDGKIVPGEAIGIITAQSFGEPSTQMALNVFHFAGIQEMQITLGLPRLIEIFDARKNPSTATMEIYLEKEFNNEKSARMIAEKIKEVRLEDIISEIKINFSDKRIEAEIDKESLKQTHISLNTVAERLNEEGFKIKIKGDGLVLNAEGMDFKNIYKLKEKIKKCVISGVEGIAQILVVKRENEYVILTYGSNLEDIIKVKGVNPEKTNTNNFYEIQKVLGVEAVRKSIINEIYKVINSQGLDIDRRHLELVADAMTSSGEIKGMTRMGIISEKSSILARASFETPIKQFVTATKTGTKDELASVIENIILNQPAPVGTGLPRLFVKVTGRLINEELEAEKKRKKAKK